MVRIKKLWQTCGPCNGSGEVDPSNNDVVIYCGTCGGDGGWWVDA